MGLAAQRSTICWWQGRQTSNMETASSNYQINFRPNCICRALFPWEVTEPKFLAEKSVTGAPKTTRFSGFEISVRNCALSHSRILIFLKTPRDSFLVAGWRMGRYTGALPNCSKGGLTKAAGFRNLSRFGSKPPDPWDARSG